MIVQKKESMIILNGLLNNLSKFAYIFFISLMLSLHAEEIKVAPLINLDAIEPSYDEDIILNNVEQFSESKRKDNDINNDNVIMIEISILNKITTNVERVKLPLKENYHYQEF